MNVTPLHDKVLVKAVVAKETTASGIIVPESVDKARPEQGEVIAVGPGKILQDGKRAVMSVSKGQIVLFKKYSPDEIKIEKEEYLMIADSDILAIIG